MLNALLNWFKLVYELFGQNNMHRSVRFFLAIFDTPLPHVGILTLSYLISTF